MWLPSIVLTNVPPVEKEPQSAGQQGALGRLRQEHSGLRPARAKQSPLKEAKSKMKSNNKQKDPESVVAGIMLPAAGVIISILVQNTFSPEINRA